MPSCFNGKCWDDGPGLGNPIEIANTAEVAEATVGVSGSYAEHVINHPVLQPWYGVLLALIVLYFVLPPILRSFGMSRNGSGGRSWRDRRESHGDGW